MLYSEFIEGTGCRETDNNYKIYKRLEIIYMTDDTMTKEDVYEWGKKLVDNSKTAEEIELENNLNEQIRGYKEEIKKYRADIKYRKEMIELDRADRSWVNYNRDVIKSYQTNIKYLKDQITALKWVLGTVGY